MNIKATVDTDIQLIALMVTKLLRKEHDIHEAPGPRDYEVLDPDIRFNGATDIQVKIPLARGSTFSVKQHWRGDDDRDLNSVLEAAITMTDDIASVYDIRQNVIDMTTEVRAAVTREIAKAKRRGLSYRLLSATPCPIHDRVRDGVAVKVIFERLSGSLRPEPATFDAGSVAEVVYAFENCREEQERRVTRRAHLDATGATGRIESVVVKAMQEAGHDMVDVLKLLVTSDDWIVDVGERGNEKGMFCLHWNNGDVYAQITLSDGASWHEGRLTFQKAPVALDRARGRRVRDIVDNPIFGDIRVTSASGKKGEFGSVICTQDLLHFDADTGRLWAA